MARLVRIVWRVVLILLVIAIAVPVGFRLAAALRERAELAEVLPDGGGLVETETGRVYVREAGPPDGVPVLLVHGTAAWSGLWAPTMQALADAGYRAIAFDLPPFGFSERASDGDYSRAAQAGRILALTQALGVKPVIAAHSFGAAPAVEAVMQDEAAFAGLILIDGAVGLGSHETAGDLPLVMKPRILREAVVATSATNPLLTRQLLRSLLYVKDAATPEVVDILQQPMTRQGSTAAFADWLPYLLVSPADAKSTRAENYAALRLPVRIIWGAEDTVTPPEQAAELVALIPGAGLTVLPGVGHIPQIEAPEALQQALIQALDGIAPQ